MLDKIRACENPVAIHVRRGDYLERADVHFPCSPEYYNEKLSPFHHREQQFFMVGRMVGG